MTYGLDLQRELAEQSPNDWVFGAVSQPCLWPISEEERQKWLPDGETQAGREDFQDCATRGIINILEAKFSHAYRNNLISKEGRDWLYANGYVFNNRITFSDRFIAIKSGTTRAGNSLKAPLDAVYRHGLIPKMAFPARSDMDWDDYHNPDEITPEMEKLGADFARRFKINYERVFEAHYSELLKDDFLDVAVFAWPGLNNNMEHVRVTTPENHVVALFKRQWYAFDNYVDYNSDYIKKLAPDYNFFEYGYRVFVSREVLEEELRASDNTIRSLMLRVIELLTLQLSLLSKRVAGLLQ